MWIVKVVSINASLPKCLGGLQVHTHMFHIFIPSFCGGLGPRLGKSARVQVSSKVVLVGVAVTWEVRDWPVFLT